MTLSRRAFTFASLAAAFGNAARAETPPPVAQAPSGIPELEEAGGDPGYPDFRTSAKLVAVDGGQVELTLEVKNAGAATSVIVARGSRPAGDPVVQVLCNGVATALTAVQTDVDRREMMSRMGPMPRFAAVKGGETFALGPFRFALPAEASGPATVRFTLVHGKEGEPMKTSPFTVANVGLGRAAT